MTSPKVLECVSDEDLVGQAVAGEPAAFEALVVRYQERVYRLMRRLMRDHHDAEDALQGTFLQVQAKLGTFRGEAKFSTWLYRVATNTALSALRQRSRNATESLEAYLPRFDTAGLHDDPRLGVAPVAHAEERIHRQWLTAQALLALERLPDDYRTAFVLRDLEELSSADAAETLGIREDLLRQRLHRARLMLRGFLAELAGGRP